MAKNNITVIDDGSYRAAQANELAKELEGLEQRIQISCGIDAVQTALATKAKYKFHILDPLQNYEGFDLVFIPGHEPLPAAPNIVPTFGLINHIRPSTEFEAGVIAVLIGGKHVGGNFTASDASALAAALPTGAKIWVTTSKRTEKPAADALKAALPNAEFYDFNYDGQVNNPYEQMLKRAQQVVVTADSVRMVSEAASSGKTTFIFTPREVHFSYIALKNQFVSNGYALEIGSHQGSTKPLNEAGRLAQIIKNFIDYQPTTNN